ncbi:hypothetical protein V6N13_051388 [Hibiscus sabdariffa]
MGNLDTIRALGHFVALKDPAIVFVSESRLRKNKVDNISRRLGMVGSLVVDRSESCVGLFLLWNDSVQVRLLLFSDSHIDVEVEGGEIPFRFTGMYGTSDRRRKHEDWELLDRLKSRSNLPWLLGGDLNDILSYSEKDEESKRQISSILNMREELEVGNYLGLPLREEHEGESHAL